MNEAFGADLILEGGDPPKDLLCPLTLDLFEDPVVAVDGHTYERAAIEKWFQSKTTSPEVCGAFIALCPDCGHPDCDGPDEEDAGWDSDMSDPEDNR